MAIHSNYALRLPTSLKQSVEQAARDNGTSLNQFIVTAVAEKLSALKTADYFAQRSQKGNYADALAILDRTAGQPPISGDEVL
jgi:uncharacterized protein (DUF1778 family)